MRSSFHFHCKDGKYYLFIKISHIIFTYRKELSCHSGIFERQILFFNIHFGSGQALSLFSITAILISNNANYSTFANDPVFFAVY